MKYKRQITQIYIYNLSLAMNSYSLFKKNLSLSFTIYKAFKILLY